MTGLTGLTVMIPDHRRSRTDTPSNSCFLPSATPLIDKRAANGRYPYEERIPKWTATALNSIVLSTRGRQRRNDALLRRAGENNPRSRDPQAGRTAGWQPRTGRGRTARDLLERISPGPGDHR